MPCERCGTCCKPPFIKAPYMLTVDGSRCKYLREFEHEVYTSCLIRTSVAENIPSRHLVYWARHCRPFPDNHSDYESLEKIAGEKCGYVYLKNHPEEKLSG